MKKEVFWKYLRIIAVLLLPVVLAAGILIAVFHHSHSYGKEIPLGKTDRGYTFVEICQECGKERLRHYDALLTFVDDDGKMQAMLHWEKIIDATGIEISAAIIPGSIPEKTDYDTWYAYAGWDLLERMQEKGVDFVHHTFGHKNLTKLTPEEIHQDLQKAKSTLKAHNIQSNILVYPNNAHNASVDAVTANYFDFAFSCDGKAITDLSAAPYGLSRVNLNDSSKTKTITFTSDTVVECKGIKSVKKLTSEMTKAIQNNGWLVYMTHAYDSPGGKYYFDEESEQTIIDFCHKVQQMGNVKIVTLSDGVIAARELDSDKESTRLPESTTATTRPMSPISTAPSGDVLYEIADDPLSYEKMAAIPVANASMTTQELRQICVDYMKLSVSCQWVADGNYYLTNKDNPEQNFKEGKLYGGIPYINKASGNLYRFLEYYDPNTGILDSEGLRANPELFATACSGTAGWAWSRVINSAEISWTHSLNAAHGFIPVGPYVYDFDVDVFWELDANGEKVYHCNTKSVCKKNGEQVMYESYALSHLADCFTRNGHVAMAAAEPVVVRNADGTIDGTKSYIILAEQGQYTSAKSHIRVTSNGTEYRIRGSDKKKLTFAKLFEEGFLVHTFKEFLGQDPVEAGSATLSHKGSTATVKALDACLLQANYPISDVFIVVYDPLGESLYSYTYRTADHFTRELSGESFLPADALRQYATGENIIRITSQIANGQIVPVYNGTLIP